MPTLLFIEIVYYRTSVTSAENQREVSLVVLISKVPQIECLFSALSSQPIM